MRWIRFAGLVLLASVLQAGLIGVLGVGRSDIKPDLLLILLVFFASRCQTTDAVVTSFVLGFTADLVSPIRGVMGPRIISFGLFGTLLSDVQAVLSVRRPIYQGATIFITGVLTAVVGHLLASLRAENVTAGWSVPFLWQPLYSAVIGPLFSLPVGWWMHMNRRRRRSYGRITRSGK